uniref:Uncharacterized protein n=1 Tax=Tetraselmis sp. GSL018 TaxID=582737 RepID=A0A061RMI1_9CHLO|mmetsp:Transcript_25077/g.59713  ORF Transcript_25077/g.59713 Transcript_25077/m.59713 type:complete len:275 (+) Transcript_25077:2235-3059(+)
MSADATPDKQPIKPPRPEAAAEPLSSAGLPAKLPDCPGGLSCVIPVAVVDSRSRARSASSIGTLAPSADTVAGGEAEHKWLPASISAIVSDSSYGSRRCKVGDSPQPNVRALPGRGPWCCEPSPPGMSSRILPVISEVGGNASPADLPGTAFSAEGEPALIATPSEQPVLVGGSSAGASGATDEQVSDERSAVVGRPGGSPSPSASPRSPSAVCSSAGGTTAGAHEASVGVAASDEPRRPPRSTGTAMQRPSALLLAGGCGSSLAARSDLGPET